MSFSSHADTDREPLIRDAKITNGRLTIRVAEYGASLVDLRLSELNFPLILGLADIDDYPRHGLLFGAVVGHHANRIAGGSVNIAGKMYQLDTNEAPHHLHGGENSFARRRWRLESRSISIATFVLISPNGDAGYPGRLEVRATYEVLHPAILRLTLEAHSDTATIVNLCHHPYFNLDGNGEIDSHCLTIAADHYLPSRDDLIPTGEIKAVTGTPFDFRLPQLLDRKRRRADVLYNHTFCLGEATRKAPHFAARLSARSGVEMEIWTTQDGLHFYEGYKIANCPPGLDGRCYTPRSGLCLEAQNWPDSPNNEHFPSAILLAGKTYQQVTEYRFRTVHGPVD